MLGVALTIFELQLGPCLHLISDAPAFHPFGLSVVGRLDCTLEHWEVLKTNNACVTAPEILF